MKTKLTTLTLVLSFILFSFAFAEEKKDTTTPSQKQPPTPAEFQAKKPFPRVSKSAEARDKKAAETTAKSTTTITKNTKKIEQENSVFAKKAETNKWNIAEALGSNADLAMVHALLKEAGLLKTLETGDYTFFAPTNEALQQIPADEFKALGSDKEKLKNMLLYHLAKGSTTSDDILTHNGEYKTMMNGATAVIGSKDKSVLLNQSTLTYPNIRCSNGVIHIIDHVLTQNNTVQTANQNTPVKKEIKTDVNTTAAAPAVQTESSEKK